MRFGAVSAADQTGLPEGTVGMDSGVPPTGGIGR